MSSKQVLRALCVVALALSLAACGKGAPGGTGAGSDVCGLLGDSTAAFGAEAQALPGASLDGAAGSCQWVAADGRRGGDVILYDAHSLGAVTPPAEVAHLVESWDAMTETQLAPIAGLGEEAQIATDLPGYQTQIVIRKGDRVAAILAWSGDPAINGEALARQMAQTIAVAM